MKLIAQIASSLVLAACAESFDDDQPSLLQLRAAHDASSEEHVHFNASHHQPTYSGHPFGCTGREAAKNVVVCGLWGDVHQHKKFQGGGAGDSYGTGWYWMAKSKDGEFQAQAFYRQSNPNQRSWTTISHYAFKFGENILFMDRVRDGGNWNWKYYWNGVERSYTETPLGLGELYWANRGSNDSPFANAGAKNAHWGGMVGGEAARHSCFEYKSVAVWTGFQNWQAASMGPYGQPAILEVEGSIEYLDATFGQCADKQQKVLPGEMLVTPDQNTKVCTDDKLTADQCAAPDNPGVPPQTKEQLCTENNVPLEHAQELCNGQQDHGIDIYESCLYDVCASADTDAEANAVGGAAMEAALMNPRAVCGIGRPCKPCNICSTATTADLTNVVQNNLGGLGPDSGEQEIRYKNAMDLDGRQIDVVLKAEGAYVTPKPERNGNNGRGFGRFTIKTGTSTTFNFLFQDAVTHEPVSVPDIALTFYDLDEALEYRNQAGRQRETITACAAEEVYWTEDTELIHEVQGTCHAFTSTTIGNGQDNPRSVDTLTKVQAARSITYEFHQRAHIYWSAEIIGNRNNPRPVLFSFHPQVACGASDSETQCGRPVASDLLLNGDFEEAFTTDSYEYTTNVPGWTASGGTVACRTGNAPWGGVAARSGNYYLALQANGATVKQTIAGFVEGRTYSLSVSAAQRQNSPGGTNAVLRVSANGQCDLARGTCNPSGTELLNRIIGAQGMETQLMFFTADSPSMELKFENVVASGDQTVFIDAVELSIVSHSLLNGDFEEGQTTRDYVYTREIPGWAASGGVVAIRTNNAPWGGIFAQSGSYLLALQGQGANVKQAVAVIVGKVYTLRFSTAQRQNSPGGPQASLRVSVGGNVLFNSLVADAQMKPQQVTFTADRTSVELKFESTVSGAADQTVFIDSVALDSP